MPAGKPAYIWSGTEWIPRGLQIGAKYQPGQPSASASTTGDLWIDSNTNIPYVWNGTSWVITSASVNLSAYLTTASASAIYAPIASPALTGIPTAPTASVGTDNTQIATTAFVYDQASLFSNRNLLYNGAMQIHQRSASVAGITATNYYTADRWNIAISSLGTWTQTVENDAPTGSGFRKSQKMLCTVADASPSASDYLIVSQIIEGQDVQRIAKGTASAQQLTLSFWVKSNIVGTYIVNIYDYDNTRWVAGSYTISASATWERKIITFSADSTGVLDNDNAASLSVDFWLGAGSTYTSGSLSTNWNNTVGNRAPGQTNLASAINNYWQITGVQLEIGPNASQFEFKKYEQDLSECQRYYEKSYDLSVVPGSVTTSGMVMGGYIMPTAANYTIRIGTRYIVAKRAAGNVTIYDSAGNVGKVNLPDTTTNKTGAVVASNEFGLTVEGYAGATVTDARMYYHYVANAEL